MNVRAHTKPDRQFHIDVEFGLFVILLGLIFLLRITNITYNTLFVDEAIYATVGKEGLANIYTQVASAWMFGSYLYPYIAGIVDQLASAMGLRALSALLSSLAAIFVFSATRRLFGKQAALWATLIFGFTGASISLGQYAVLDSLSMPLLALALYCLIVAARATDIKENFYLLTAGLAFILSVFAKYIAIAYFPALLLIAFLLYKQQGRSLTPLLTMFVLPAVVIPGLYVWYYRADLLALLAGNYSYQAGDRWEIVKTIWEDLGLVTVLAVVGLSLAFRESFVRASVQKRWAILRSVMLILVLMLAFLSVPLYQLAVANVRSLWKHSVYSLIFLAPLGGYALATIAWRSRLYQGRRAKLGRLAGALIMTVGLIWFASAALNHQRALQHSWPDVSQVVTYLRSQALTKQSRVLASGSAIYEYYFDLGPANHEVWTSTWYMEYKGLQGKEAMVSAIRDHYFKFVVLDNYYTPEMSEALEKELITAGYIKAYEQKQKLAFEGPITIRVYTSPTITLNERSEP